MDRSEGLDWTARCVEYAGQKWHRTQGYYRNRLGESLHRRIYRDRVGGIPDGYEVHHLDGNGHNNEIENLSLVTRAQHLKIQPRNLDPSKAREVSHIRDVRGECRVCGGEFWAQRLHRNHQCYCSKLCRNQAGYAARKVLANCPIC
ncbi:MAG: HNH endonuclease, partial [Proteobacteria bacterium]|nr:HNH endonuclease [Pseudomonadota bacterium]